jgi:hypothetical protein
VIATYRGQHNHDIDFPHLLTAHPMLNLVHAQPTTRLQEIKDQILQDIRQNKKIRKGIDTIPPRLPQASATVPRLTPASPSNAQQKSATSSLPVFPTIPDPSFGGSQSKSQTPKPTLPSLSSFGLSLMEHP